MNKTLRFYIVFIVFACATVCTLAEDILDGYIDEFIVKSDFVKDEQLALLDGLHSQIEPSPQKSASAQLILESERLNEKQLNKTKELRQELKDSSIMSLPNKADSNINSQLQDVLSQLKSLSFSEMPETVDSEPEVQLQASPVAAKVQADVDKADSIEPAKSQPSRQNDQPIVILPDDTSGVVDSFELAESLFHIGDKANALKYYRKSLKISLPIGNKPNPKRAWILFQIGNSLYSYDNIAAIKVYEQLILEHPSSDWTNCARTKLQVLKWFLVEKPIALTMSEVK